MPPNSYWFDGLLSSEPYKNGNEVGMTAYYVLLLKKAGLPYLDVLNKLEECEQRSGVWSRYNDQLINVKIDDMIMLSCADVMIVSRIHAHGERTGWVFDLLSDKSGLSFSNKDVWFGRSLGWVANVTMRARLPVGWFLRSAWAGAMILSAHKSVYRADGSIQNQDSLMQNHAMVLAYEMGDQKDWLSSYAVKYWRRKKPIPMREIVTSYTKDVGHPLIEMIGENE